MAAKSYKRGRRGSEPNEAVGEIKLNRDLEGDELYGGAGRGPQRRARLGCWTGTVDGELDGDLHGAADEELGEHLHGEEHDGAVDGELAGYLRGEELTRSGLGERSRQATRSGVA
jgi:hypothetical protein